MQVSKRGNSLGIRRTRALLARLRKFRGRLPKDFRFDRLEANEPR